MIIQIQHPRKIKRKYYPGGFSLTELMIVVAIIGLLAAIGLTVFNNYINNSRINTSDARYKILVDKVKSEHQAFVGGLDISSMYGELLGPTSTCGEYISAIQSYYEFNSDYFNIFNNSIKLVECADSNPNNSTVDSCGACNGLCINIEDLAMGSILLNCIDGYDSTFINDEFGLQMVLNNDVPE